jgi:hypothetical protein
VAVVGAAILWLSMTTLVQAHGGPANESVNPDDPNCMGQLASLHAHDYNGVAHALADLHPDLGGPFDSVKDQMKAFKAYCNGELGGPVDPPSGF